jgi:2-hydroxy-3-keto-5-methylthiopentenyl-1-phosphate phosphatase
MRAPLVIDWDGTVTEVDGLHLVLERFGDLGVFERSEAALGRSLSLREVIALEFETVHAHLSEVVAWVRENVTVRAGFSELARVRRPLIVSSGFHELIDPVLAREGTELDVIANRLDPQPNGWRTIFREQPICDVCGEHCKRADLADLDAFVYVGDGYSDRCVAKAATRVFARDGLAAYLAREGVPFEPFEDFYDVERVLAGAEVVPPGRSVGRKT